MPHPEVLIVGAGPTGLAMACELTRRGVACRIIDKAPQPATTSRALGVQARTLELFEHLGIADAAVAAGHRVHGLNVSSGRKRIVHLNADPIPSRYNFVLILPQSETERLLAERLAALGLVPERGVELTGLTQDGDGVEAVLRRGAVEERLRVRWLIGCDGAHSAVRHVLGMAFEGKAFPEYFSLADVRLDGHFPGDEVEVHLGKGGDLVALFPLDAEERCRVVVEHHQPPPDESEPPLEELQAAVDAAGVPKTRLCDPVWRARFRISQRQVGSYRQGRVFVAGDAAHIHSPIGGQGMNTGIQDAANLAWKLALVSSGRGRPELLDSYQQERHPIGQALLHATGTFTRVVTLRNPVAEAVRNRIAAIATSFDFVQDRLRSALSELAVGYRGSPLVQDDVHRGLVARMAGWLHADAGPRAGDRAPDGPAVRADGKPVRLFEVMPGIRHTLLLFVGRRTAAEDVRRRQEILEEVARKDAGLIDGYLVAHGASEAGAATAAVLLDPDAALHRAYGADDEMLYLIRPDGYVGYRTAPADAAKLRAYLGRIFI